MVEAEIGVLLAMQDEEAQAVVEGEVEGLIMELVLGFQSVLHLIVVQVMEEMDLQVEGEVAFTKTLLLLVMEEMVVPAPVFWEILHQLVMVMEEMEDMLLVIF